MKLSPSFTVTIFTAVALQGCAAIAPHANTYNDLSAEGRTKLATCYRTELGNDHGAEIKSLRPQLDVSMRALFRDASDKDYAAMANESLNQFVSRRNCAIQMKIDMESIPVPMPE